MEEGVGEKEQKMYRIKRDFEIKYGTELESAGSVEGVLLSKGFVIPHLVIYNIDPNDYNRFITFVKSEAGGKGFRGLKLLLDLADMKNAVMSQAREQNPEGKRLVKVCGRDE